jgi:hypothetical protein
MLGWTVDVSLINTFLATGREIRAVEQRLAAMGPRDENRTRLGNECRRLIGRQQEEIVAAVRAGAGWSTVEFALRLHGQYAGRDVASAEPTPAECVGELMQKFGPVVVLEALDHVRGLVDEAGIVAGAAPV